MNSRRGFLSMTAGAVAVTPAVATPPVPPPHLDVRLLRLDAELTMSWAVENEAWTCRGYKAENDDDSPYTIAANACTAATGEIVGEIARTPALTLDGLRVKLRAVMWCRSNEPVSAEDFTWGGTPATDARLLASIINDLFTVREISA